MHTLLTEYISAYVVINLSKITVGEERSELIIQPDNLLFPAFELENFHFVVVHLKPGPFFQVRHLH
jgi:hypothetical protein